MNIVLTEQTRIGIMADSHGNPRVIEKAVSLLTKRECNRVFHLGDICDTNQPETVDECVGLVMHHGITAVKGNNDHIIVVNFNGSTAGSIKKESIAFLEGLPPLIKSGDVEFTHSLPFYSWMGNSALMRVVEESDLHLFFSETSFRVLFRGHSHNPELFTWETGSVKKSIFRPGEIYKLEPRYRYVITCGALIEDYCLIWHRNTDSVECLSL